MQTLFAALQTLVTGVFIALALLALVQWRRRPGPATAWLAASFGLLGAVVAAGELIPENATSPAAEWATKLLIVGIVLFPYLLWRFQLVFRPAPRWLARAATGVTAVTAAASLALPEVPGPGEPLGPAFQAFVVLVLVQWTALMATTAVRLWRAGSGQPTVARRRMRMMAVASLWLAAALLLAGAVSGGEEATATEVVVQLLALASGPFFLLGFAPPAIIRAAWRRPEERRLRDAEVQLMRSETPDDVGAVLLPHVSRLLGGGPVELFDNRGTLLAAEEGTGVDATDGNRLDVDLAYGRLSAQPSPFAPFFGVDETELMRGFAALADLALSRADLFVQLRRSNAELEQFAYVASHDLQEPLRTVASYAELLARRYRGQLDDKADRHIGFVVDGCQRMQDLINDLLQFSRVGTKAGPLVLTDLDLPLDRALHDLQAAIDASGATVRRGDLPPVEVDPAQLALVFQNLIGNAIKFRGPQPPVIDVRGELADGELIVTVEDNGIGIEPQYAERIFAIFQRLHTRAEYPGTGLGLAICKKVVERHGGRIWLADTSSPGTAFAFSLPVQRNADEPRPNG